MERSSYIARDGKTLSMVVWDKIPAPVGVVLLMHGMYDHIARYDDFAQALNKAGYIVFGTDHRAHGYTDKDNRGKVREDRSVFEDTVADNIELTTYAKEKYNLPIIIFGYGYGSFLVQRYLSYTSSDIAGAVLCGGAKINDTMLDIARLLTKNSNLPSKKDKEGDAFTTLSLGAFDKAYKDEGKNAWLSQDIEQVEKHNADELCSISYSKGFYHYLFKGLKAISNAQHNTLRKDLPLLIISGSDDKVGLNGKNVVKLEQQYKNLGLNPKINLYKNARHNILGEINRFEVYEDVINFANSCIIK